MIELEMKEALELIKRAKKSPSPNRFNKKLTWSFDLKCFYINDLWSPIPSHFFYGDRHLFWTPVGIDIMDNKIDNLRGEILEEDFVDFGLNLPKGLEWLTQGKELEQTLYYWTEKGEEFLHSYSFKPLDPEDLFVIENWEFREALFFSEYQCYVLLLRLVKKFWCGKDAPDHHKAICYWDEEFTGLENRYTLKLGEWEINQRLLNTLLANNNFVEYSGTTIWQESEDVWKIILR
jgi:hypothetical protein